MAFRSARRLIDVGKTLEVGCKFSDLRSPNEDLFALLVFSKLCMFVDISPFLIPRSSHEVNVAAHADDIPLAETEFPWRLVAYLLPIDTVRAPPYISPGRPFERVHSSHQVDVALVGYDTTPAAALAKKWGWFCPRASLVDQLPALQRIVCAPRLSLVLKFIATICAPEQKGVNQHTHKGQGIIRAKWPRVLQGNVHPPKTKRAPPCTTKCMPAHAVQPGSGHFSQTLPSESHRERHRDELIALR
eukprot:5687389-Prymnesium_polylepis.1